MAYDITKKRLRETAEIELDEADESPMLDDEGNRLSVTVHGPGSKVWRQADAEVNRRKASRAGKNLKTLTSSMTEHKYDDDTYFLTSITISFNGWTYPHPKEDGEWQNKREMFEAAYSDYQLSHIREQVISGGGDYENFMGNGTKQSPATSDNSHG